MKIGQDVQRLTPQEWLSHLGALFFASRHLQDWFAQVLKGFHLKELDFFLMWWLAARPDAPPSQRFVADRLGLSPARVSGLLEHLKKSGNLQSFRPEHDRRQQLWQLTPTGKEALSRVLHEVGEHLAQSSSDHPSNQSVRLAEALQHLESLGVRVSPSDSVPYPADEAGSAFPDVPVLGNRVDATKNSESTIGKEAA